MKRILIIAATEPELCGLRGLVCGVGPVEAASATARALALDRPDAVLHVGVAGGRGLEPGTIVVGTEAVYVDITAAIPVGSKAAPDPVVFRTACDALPGAEAHDIATSAGVFYSKGFRVEAMEGFAVLRACELAGVPAVEVRAVSNEIGEEDRARWEIARALEALAEALPQLLSALGD